MEDRNKRRFRHPKRVTDDVRGTTAGSDVLLAGPVTMGAPVLPISVEDEEVSIQFSIFFMRQIFLCPRRFLLTEMCSPYSVPDRVAATP